MSNKLEHKPAFPTNEGDTYDGMELLDYFAAEAMKIFLKKEHVKQTFSGEYDFIAREAYIMAQAMMKVREEYVR